MFSNSFYFGYFCTTEKKITTKGKGDSKQKYINKKTKNYLEKMLGVKQ